MDVGLSLAPDGVMWNAVDVWSYEAGSLVESTELSKKKD